MEIQEVEGLAMEKKFVKDITDITNSQFFASVRYEIALTVERKWLPDRVLDYKYED